MQEINPQAFIVNDPVQLDKTPTVLEMDATKKEKKKALKKVGKKLSKMQDTMYAHNRHGVLVCLQGMDTSGKDSLIREVFSKFNPRGMVVHSFKSPSRIELQYDYLWRHHLALPQKGKYAIFNRSHYENVLVTRVNPKFLLSENIPGIERVEDIPPDFWDKRYEQIRNFEKHIVQNGTIVFKFFLHLSKDEQRQRLLRRLEKKEKIWKFTPSDISERELWDEYQKHYEEAINRTSTPHAPWHIIPADDKKMARYIVAKIIHEEMSKYTDIQEPAPDEAVKDNLEVYKDILSKV
jgi:PPK2 family polyphosphate:nucleotide phosphotransferase